MRVTRIDSLSLPGLDAYRTMRRPKEHRERGIFVAEGEKVVRRLVQSDIRIVSILLTGDWLDRYTDILTDRGVEDGIYVADKTLLEEIVGYGLHQGIMAIGRVPDSEDVFEAVAKSGEPRLLVAVDGVANSENMGVIVRNCAAFGVDSLIVGETSCDPYLRRAVRNSMGSVFRLHISKVDQLARTLRRLNEEFAFNIIAAHPREGSADLNDVDLTGNVCIVLGSEGEGISAAALEASTSRVQIRMHNDIDSINVASSAGIFLYEALKQRGSRPHPAG